MGSLRDRLKQNGSTGSLNKTAGTQRITRPVDNSFVRPTQRTISGVADNTQPLAARHKPATPQSTVEINISLPSLEQIKKRLLSLIRLIVRLIRTLARHLSKLPIRRLKHLIAGSRNFRLAIGGGLVLLIAGGILLGVRQDHAIAEPTTAAGTPNRPILDKGKGKPDYDTVSPDGSGIDKLGGWTRISPPDKNAVYAYADNIKGISITVSQQPLPKNFEADTDESIAKLAKGFSANETFKTNDTTAYIGKSASGQQSVIVGKSDILILLKSASSISTSDWANYINNLQ